MNLNSMKPSELIAVVGSIDPDANGTGDIDTGWVPIKDFAAFMAIIQAGDLGSSATLDAKLQHASSSGGAGAEDITGKAITQLTQAGTDSNKQAIINLRPEECVGAALSFKSGTSTHVRLRVTVGTATSDAGALLLGILPKLQPTTDLDLTAVDEIKG